MMGNSDRGVKIPARFIQPMLLLKTEQLAEGDGWLRELKLDGYRAIAFKSSARIHLRSRHDHDFARRYPDVVKALEWTGENHLRHTRFVALRDDRPAQEVRRE
jgi:ATP-dependent DNA ligase